MPQPRLHRLLHFLANPGDALGAAVLAQELFFDTAFFVDGLCEQLAGAGVGGAVSEVLGGGPARACAEDEDFAQRVRA